MERLYVLPAIHCQKASFFNYALQQYTEVSVTPQDCGDDFIDNGGLKDLDGTFMKLPQQHFTSLDINDYDCKLVFVADIKSASQGLLKDTEITINFIGGQAQLFTSNKTITNIGFSTSKIPGAQLSQGSVIYNTVNLDKGYRGQLPGDTAPSDLTFRILGPENIKTFEVIDKPKNFTAKAPSGCSDEK